MEDVKMDAEVVEKPEVEEQPKKKPVKARKKKSEPKVPKKREFAPDELVECESLTDHVTIDRIKNARGSKFFCGYERAVIFQDRGYLKIIEK